MKTTVEELSQSIGQVAPSASALGVNFDELLASISALTTGGIQTSVAATQIRATFSNLAKPTENLSNAFKKAGIESIDLALKNDGLVETLRKVVGTTDGTASAIQALFGSVEAGSAVLALTSDQIGGTFTSTLEDMRSSAENAGETTQQAFEKIANTSQFQLKKLQGQVSAFGTEIGIVLAPAFSSLLSVAINAFNGLSQLFEDNKQTIQQYVISFSNGIQAVANTLTNFIAIVQDNIELIKALAVGLGAGALAFGAYTVAINATAIATTVLTTATTAFASVIAVLTSPVTLVVGAIAALSAGVYLAIKNIELVKAVFFDLSSALLKAVAPALNLVIDIFYNMKQAIDVFTSSIRIIIGAFSSLVTFILGKVVKSFDGFLGAIEQVVGIFDDDLKKSISSARKSIDNLISSVEDSAKEFNEDAKAKLKNAKDTERYVKTSKQAKEGVELLAKALEEESKSQYSLYEQKKLNNSIEEQTIDIKKESIKIEDESKKAIDGIKQANIEATSAINENNSAVNNNVLAMQASSQADKENIETKKELIKNTTLMTDAQYAALDAHNQYAESMKQLAKETAEAEKKKAEEIRRSQEQQIANINKIKEETDRLNATAIAEKKVAISLIDNAEYQEARSFLGKDELTKKLIEIELSNSDDEAIALKKKLQAEVNLIKLQQDIAKPTLFQSLKNQMANVALSFKKGLQAATNIVKSSFSLIQMDFISSFQGVIENVVSAPKKILETFGNFDKVLDDFNDEIPNIVDNFVNNLPKIIDGIIENIPAITDAIIKQAPIIINAIVDNTPKIIKALLEFVPALISLMPEVVNGIIKLIPKIIDSITEKAPVIIASLIQALPGIFNAIINGLPAIISSLIQLIPTIIAEIVKNVPVIFTSLLNNIPLLIERVVFELPRIITTIINSIPLIVSTFIKAIPEITLGFIKSIPSIISALASGLWNSLKNIFINLGKSIWDGLLSVFNPAKLFGDIGGGVQKAVGGIGGFFNDIGKAIGGFFGFSNGGLVGGLPSNGINSKNNDVIPALLSAGEMVIPRSAVAQGLQGVNAFAMKTLGETRDKFANGGIVGKNKAYNTLQSVENNGIMNNGSSEIKSLRAELKTMLFTIARNGQKIEAILNGWEGQGLPLERGF